MTPAPDPAYFALVGGDVVLLVARIRFPDIAQAASALHPLWKDDIGLLDLPDDPSSVALTPEQAAAVVSVWGLSLADEIPVRSPIPPLIRRMPANWSGLSPAEESAWLLDVARRGWFSRSRRRIRRRSSTPPRSSALTGSGASGYVLSPSPNGAGNEDLTHHPWHDNGLANGNGAGAHGR